jgi:hypothetical protein
VRDLRRRTWVGAAAGLAVLIAIMALTAACSKGGRSVMRGPIIGVKIYEHPGPFGPLIREWRDLGINTAFVSEGLAANKDFRALARANAIALFIIYPVFQNPEALKERPGLAAVTAEGKTARDDWVEFVCPSRDDYLSERAEHLRSLVAECDPEAVSLDFIRYFVFWEKVYPERSPDSLPQTCFCPVCLDRFSREMGVRVPAGLETTPEVARWILDVHPAEWAEWKCRVIARAVDRLAKSARRAKPGVFVNIHIVPWRKDDFSGAAKAVAGQDAARLASLSDFLSPMAYHHMVLRTPTWVHEVTADLFAQTGKPVLPSIQVSEAYIEKPLPAAEFRAALEEALRPPSRGVVLWSWDALDKAPEKKAVFKSVVGLKNRPR